MFWVLNMKAMLRTSAKSTTTLNFCLQKTYDIQRKKGNSVWGSEGLGKMLNVCPFEVRFTFSLK